MSVPVPPSGETAPDDSLRRQAAAALSPLLPAAWRRPGGLPSTAELWQFLTAWTSRARAQLNELEGYLLAAAAEPALSPLGPERALEELGRVRDWLQELEASSHLEAFVAAVRSRPAMLATYQRLEAWRIFWESPQRSRLVLAYRYLTSEDLAFPEGGPFQELRELRAALMDMLADPEVVLQEVGRQRFFDGLAAFRFRYVEVYRQEHERRRSPEALAPYRRLREEPAYRLLQRLQRLEGAPVRAGLAHLESRLRTILASQCPGVDEAVLHTRPTCTCGFRLDEPPPEPPDLLAQDMRREVWHGVRILADPEVKRRLHALLTDLRHRPGSAARAGTLERLLTMVERGLAEGMDSAPSGTGEEEPTAVLERLLDEDVLAMLNEGLRPRDQVWLRPLEPLVEELAGRDWTWDQLQDAVTRWALGALPPSPGMLIRPVWAGEREHSFSEAPARARPRRSRPAVEVGPAASGPFPQTFREWEAFYEALLAAGGPADEPVREAFRRFYRQAARSEPGSGGETPVSLSLFDPPFEEGLLAGIKPPSTLPLLLERARCWNEVGGKGPLRLMWVDGLRYDVGRAFLQRVADQVEVQEKGFLWVFPPATTAGQMARVDARGIRFRLRERQGAPWSADSIVYLRGQEEATSAGHPTLAELVDILVQEAVAWFRAEPEGEWLIFSDHGFYAVGSGLAGPGSPEGTGRRERVMFRQGGDTMEEVLVPWARLRWREGNGAGAEKSVPSVSRAGAAGTPLKGTASKLAGS